jgi:hypothetical protein
VSWDRPTAADALAAVLGDATAGMIPPASVFAQPPSTYNPPALVIQYPTSVMLHQPAFTIDTASLSVLAVAGLEEPDTVDLLLALAVAAVEGDSQLGGAVQHAHPVEHRLWRIVNVAGADYLTAELALEIRM